MIDPEHFRRIDKIFQAALEVQSDERRSFISAACNGDDSLIKEVESLLSADRREWELVKNPAFEIVAPLLATRTPELISGEAFGHFNICSLLGAGGMGQVYLAEDSRLGRKVALKLLPSEFTRDEKRLGRFQNEARAASALNHPNILTIYDIAEIDGKQFIATEFVDGGTLRNRIKHERLTIENALDVAIQVAGALSAAHQAGIIHRDIKPENIMLRRDGLVKVLDFGLAKLVDGPDVAADSRTIIRSGFDDIESRKWGEGNAQTDVGLLLGTLPYMSPEQASGLEVDARSDIFSFGVVIYEMITGNQPFNCETRKELLDSIQKADASGLLYSRTVPETLQKIINRCLRQSKDERYQSMALLLADLKSIKENSVSGVSAKGFAVTDTLRRRKMATLILATFFIIAGPVAYSLYRFVSQARHVPFQQFRATEIAKGAHDAVISRDGKKVAYVSHESGQHSIWLRELDASSPVQIVPPGAIRIAALTFSPDGKDLFYIRYDIKNSLSNALHQINLTTGVSKKLFSEVHSAISFSPDGQKFAFFRRAIDQVSGNALMIAIVDGLSVQELVRKEPPRAFADYPFGLAWAPDGNVIACGVTDAKTGQAELIEVHVADGSEKIIPTGGFRAPVGISWIQDGRGILLSAVFGAKRGSPTRQVWFVSYPTGELRRVTNDLSDYAGLSVSGDSTSFVSQEGRRADILTIMPLSGREVVPAVGSGRYLFAGYSWTHEGKIVYAQRTADTSDLWLMDQDGKNQRQLTFDGDNWQPVVTADWRYVLVVSGSNVCRMDLETKEKKIIPQLGEYAAYKPTPDGKEIVYCEIKIGTNYLLKIPIDGGDPLTLTDRNSGFRSWDVSPDGKWVAYVHRDSSSTASIELISITGGKPVRTLPLPSDPNSASTLRWTPDGKSLMYIYPAGGVANVWSQPLIGGTPKQITDFKSQPVMDFEVSPDGKTLLCRQMSGGPSVIALVRDSR